MSPSRRFTLAVAGCALVWATSAATLVPTEAQNQSAATAGRAKAGDVFKNVTTSTLKELTVDDFVASMGVITADLGLDCADCHPNAGTDRANFAVDSARKNTARRMVEMVATINRTTFGGVQRVTCWTCHHGRITPATTIDLDTLYDAPNAENDDIVRPDPNQPPADRIFDRYLQALGGAQRLASLRSFVATGVSIGYGGFGGNAEFSIFANAPNQRTTLISFKDHPERGDSIWAFDGRAGWVKVPRGLLGEYEILGGELDGARLEAQLSFPGQIKQALTNWRVGTRSLGDRDFVVVQGSGARGFLATLYFDQQSGLLTRLIRYGPSPVGRVATQIDYSDYREVDGIKFPFEYSFSWLDGRYSAKLNDIKTNVAIDAAKFGRPSAK
jgi:Photosynthetic reaction centre cytochrome C subunit